MELDSIELEGMELGYAEFMEFAEAGCSGHLDPENFGSVFEIKADGIYVKKVPKYRSDTEGAGCTDPAPQRQNR